MRPLRRLAARLAAALSGRRRERSADLFDEELESHLQLHIDDNVRSGMPPDEARRVAVLKLGGVESARERYRDQAAIPWVEHLGQDFRFALRQLRRAPAFAVTAVVTLALGTAAALSILAFVDAALVRPLPYADPARLVAATGRTAEIPHGVLSYPDFLDWKRLNTSFGAFEMHTGGGAALVSPSGPELVPLARVTSGFFRALGVAPALGRDFLAAEEVPGSARTVILTDAAWQGRFGGRPDVIGQTLTLDGEPATIVGVLPAGFHFAPRGRPDFWVPFQPTTGCAQRRSCHAMEAVARLKDGVSVERAREELTAIAAALEREYPDSNRGQGASVRRLDEAILGDIRPTLAALLGGAVLLLAIAWINVVSLLLVRTESRRRELALRSTLGASSGRLARQFLTEALALVAGATALGLALAAVAVDLLSRLVSIEMLDRLPFLGGVAVGPRLLAAAAGLAVVATFVVALAPAVRIRLGGPRDALADGGRGSSGTVWKRLGFRLVVLELATAMVLLVGASLLGRSVHRLLTVELGFSPDRLATIQVAGVGPRFEPDEAGIRLAREAESRVAALPGVEAVGIAGQLPVSFNGNTDWIRLVGQPWDGRHIDVNERPVSAGYFAAVGARLVAGRSFTASDTLGRPRVAIINRTLAARFGGQDPVGQRYGDRELTPGSLKEIVGVVDDIREGALDAEVWPAVYVPFEQDPSAFFSVVARTSHDPHAILIQLGTAIGQIDPDVGTRNPAEMRDRIENSPVAYVRRSSTWLVGGFAGLALVLSVVGLYGVVAYSVGQRTREIGLRIAMGAERSTVYRLILGEAGRIIALGVAAGALGAVAAAGMLRSLLFETAPWDLPTLVTVGMVLAAAALLASYLPARRAASLNPIDALRVE